MRACVEVRMALLPYCPLKKLPSFLPRKGNIAPGSFIPSSSLHFFVQTALHYDYTAEHFTRGALEDYSVRLKQFWEKLADTRLRTAEAIKKFSGENVTYPGTIMAV